MRNCSILCITSRLLHECKETGPLTILVYCTLCPPPKKNTWLPYLGKSQNTKNDHVLLSQQILSAIKRVAERCLFTKQYVAYGEIGHFLRSVISQGKVVALDRWGGKWNHLSMTHRLATNYAKIYCNRTPIVKVIVENVVTCFLGGHSVEYLCPTDTHYVPSVLVKSGSVHTIHDSCPVFSF